MKFYAFKNISLNPSEPEEGDAGGGLSAGSHVIETDKFE